jgi:mono/diheme cytochrome c family protein
MSVDKMEVKAMKAMIVLATAAWLGGAASAAAQEGDVAAGQAYAKQVCAECHAVLPNEQISPLPEAPTFQNVANMRGMTEMALSVFLQTSHPTMPNIVLKPDDLRNVVAYIVSLKAKD